MQPIALEVRDLVADPVVSASFSVRYGEIVCLAGLLGAGRTEVCEAIFGARPIQSGSVLVDGQRAAPAQPVGCHGGGHLDAARGPQGERPVHRLHHHRQRRRRQPAGLHARGPAVEGRDAARSAERYVDELRVATPNVEREVRNLSGGNQQKVLLAKWLAREPRILIVDEPTRGVDVGSKADIYRILRDLAASGMALLVVSSDLPEVLALAHRIVVMSERRVAGELDAATATEIAILELAAPKAASRREQHEQRHSRRSARLPPDAPTEGPARARSRGMDLLVRIATERQLLLVVLIVALIVADDDPRADDLPARRERGRRPPRHRADRHPGLRHDGADDQRHVRPVDRRHPRLFRHHGRARRQVARACRRSSRSWSAACWGVLLGVINGVLVTRFKINALIATLATLSIYRGGLQLVSGAGVTNIGNGFTIFGQTQILGIYSPFWFMAVIVLLFAFLVGRTRYFRQAYYIGGNARAAKLSGINVDRTVFSFFVIMGLLVRPRRRAARLAPQHGGGARRARCRAQGDHRGGARRRQPVGRRRHDLRRLPRRAVHGAAAERHDHRRHQPFWQLIVVGIVLLLSVGLDQFARLAAAPEMRR